MFAVLLLLLIQGNIKGINYKAVLLIIATGVSIAFNDIPIVFNVTNRWLGWMLVFVIFGPLIKSYPFYVFRKNAFKAVVIICEVIGVGSFIWYLLGFPNLGRGIFTGLTFHAMMLGPLAGIGALSLFNRFLSLKGIYRIACFFAFVFSLLSVLLASSRAALGSLLVVIIISIVLKYKKRTVLVFAALFVVFVFQLPYAKQWSVFTEGIAQKNQRDSRGPLWSARIKEFNSSKIIGIGFASVAFGSEGMNDEGGLEPGSSWLSVLSMTGIFGFLAFVIISLVNYSRLGLFLIKRNFRMELSVILGVLSFFFISFFAEGYVYASGAFLCSFFWLTIGVSEELFISRKC